MNQGLVTQAVNALIESARNALVGANLSQTASGFKGKDGKALTLDRSAGENTIYALTQYQKSRNGCLEVDGICGPATWKDLIAL